MPESEHSCRLVSRDEFDSFEREDAAEQVAGREVDHVYGIREDVGRADLQSVRYPFRTGWDTQAAMLDAQTDCEQRGGMEFEPAAEFVQQGAAPACVACGNDRDHDMRHNANPGATKSRSVHAKDVVTREIDDEEREVLRVPISSTRADREGDAFSEQALRGMADQIREEQPLVFQNHGLAGNFFEAIPYDQAHTIGTHFDAEVVEADDGHHELFAFINPDHTHPEGERMLRQVRDEKQAIKFSVGFRILEEADDLPESERPERANEIPGRLFMRADLLEDSKVGIPANPDASVTAMAGKSAGLADGLPGYRIHPALRAMLGDGHHAHDAEGAGAYAAKGAGGGPEGGEKPDLKDVPNNETRKGPSKGTDGDTDDETDRDGLRAELDTLRADMASLADDVATLRDAVDGETATEGSPDETDDAGDPQGTVTVGRDEYADLQKRLEELEEARDAGIGESQTADPTTDESPTESKYAEVEEAAETAETKDENGGEQTTNHTTPLTQQR